jgi:hypothetical protein
VRIYSRKTEQALNTGYEKGDARRNSHVPPSSNENTNKNNSNGSKLIED